MNRPRCKAFTLIELLVVIGIIALLIAILLPVLARAREQAITLKCLANLRTCGQAFEMYADEHKGYLPFPETTYGDRVLWFSVIDQYLNSIANNNRSSTSSAAVNNRAYSEYKQCPLVNNLLSLTSNSNDSQTSSTETDSELTHSYKMNSCLRHYGSGGTFVQVKQVQLPNSSNFVLMADGISMDITGVGSQTQSKAMSVDPNGLTLGVASCPMLRHRGACNVLFVDGHAESETLPLEKVSPKALTGSPATPVPSWQAEYLDSSGDEVWMKQTTPPSTTATIATRNPRMPLQWSDIPNVNR